MLPSFVGVEVTTNELGRFRHPLQHRESAGLVQRLVQVPALWALHARRTTKQAGAATEHPRRVLDPPFERLESALGYPYSPRVTVVDEDRRCPGLEVDVRREAADVPAVAHRPQR